MSDSAKDNSQFRLPASSAVEQAREKKCTSKADCCGPNCDCGAIPSRMPPGNWHAIEGANGRCACGPDEACGAKLQRFIDALLASVVQPYEAEIATLKAELAIASDVRALADSEDAILRNYDAEIARFREQEIEPLKARAERAEAALKDNDQGAALLPDPPLASPPTTETLPKCEETLDLRALQSKANDGDTAAQAQLDHVTRQYHEQRMTKLHFDQPELPSLQITRQAIIDALVKNGVLGAREAVDRLIIAAKQDKAAWTEVGKLLNFGTDDPWVLVGALQAHFGSGTDAHQEQVDATRRSAAQKSDSHIPAVLAQQETDRPEPWATLQRQDAEAIGMWSSRALKAEAQVEALTRQLEEQQG